MSWVDERLSWDPEQHGGITQVPFIGSAITLPEETEIWLPDITLYNSHVGQTQTLEPAGAAMVQSNGAIFWSRPGMLDVLCRFSGLVAFPFDRLSCKMEFGGWMFSGGYQGIELMGDGYAFSLQEETAGSSYQEYSIGSVRCDITTFEYACCPNEPWPTLRYTIELTRSNHYYEFSMLMPTVLLCCVSFMVFGLKHEVGERLSFGITLVLAMVLMQTLVSAMLPVCGELLWVELFFFYNLVFSIFALLETCTVLYFAHLTQPHVIPTWVVAVVAACLSAPAGWCTSAGGRNTPSSQPDQPLGRQTASTTDEGSQSDSTTVSALRRQQTRSSVMLREPRAVSERESAAGAFYRRMVASHRRRQRSSGSAPAPTAEASREPDLAFAARRFVGGLPQPRELLVTRPPSAEDAARLVYFERLFYLLDVQAKGAIRVDEMGHLLSFLAFEASEEERIKSLLQADEQADGTLTRGEFMELCVEMLWDKSVMVLEAAAANYESSRVQLERRNLIYWRKVSAKIDLWARFCVPVLYVAGLVFIFKMDLSDPYGEPDAEGEIYSGMFQGMWEVRITTAGRIWLALLLLLLFGLGAAYLCFRRVAIRKCLPGGGSDGPKPSGIDPRFCGNRRLLPDKKHVRRRIRMDRAQFFRPEMGMFVAGGERGADAAARTGARPAAGGGAPERPVPVRPAGAVGRVALGQWRLGRKRPP